MKVHSKKCTVLMACVVVSGSAAAQTIERDAGMQTRAAILRLANEIEAFGESKGRLPRDIGELCAHHGFSVSTCQFRTGPLLGRDAWQRPLHYTSEGDYYEILSLGRDGEARTGDDIFFRSRDAQRLVRKWSGCYELQSLGSPQLDGTIIKLDTLKLSAGTYLANPESLLGLTGFRRWTPLGDDTLNVLWSSAEQSIVFILRANGIVLSGVVDIGLGSVANPTYRRDVIALRVACPWRDEQSEFLE